MQLPPYHLLGIEVTLSDGTTSEVMGTFEDLDIHTVDFPDNILIQKVQISREIPTLAAINFLDSDDNQIAMIGKPNTDFEDVVTIPADHLIIGFGTEFPVSQPKDYLINRLSILSFKLDDHE